MTKRLTYDCANFLEFVGNLVACHAGLFFDSSSGEYDAVLSSLAIALAMRHGPALGDP
jgi:hypothetical protein